MITKSLFGKTKDDQDVHAYELKNENGTSITILTLGGIIQSIKVPDKNGKFDDVTTGFDNVADYEVNPAYFGAIIGRVANRIFRGEFDIDGVTYRASLNQEQACLHGGL
ncbi:hypothetical protein HELRODRAFT_178112 [Helobdella robusta]|uniref:Galactose mutarotase n=1 Tax=Helobdella robusta TaxID=6412 RepID=T1FCR5_HELRO|nr:hypothetical protein HELRODRAFT_178112 [Helobdella robusta]ESN97326.1 hypothetical protein HELRODRAFT_178112 [Helobdella robusta]